MTEEEIWFNIDGATYFNILDGMSYEEAREEAIKEFKEMYGETNDLQLQ